MSNRFGPSVEDSGRNMVENLGSVGLTIARVQSWTIRKVQRGRVWYSGIQSDLLRTAQTKNKTLSEYVLHKYQLYRRLKFSLTEEAVVMTVVDLIRDEFRIHVRNQQLEAFSKQRVLVHVVVVSRPKYWIRWAWALILCFTYSSPQF